MILNTRRLIYQLFKGVFGAEPNADTITALKDDFTHEVLELLLDEEALAPFLELSKNLSIANLDSLKSEYTYLFIGPNKLPAPPWGSVYIGKEKLLFTKSTLEVRGAYLKYNLIHSNYPHAADDHISTELDFMAYLSKRSITAQTLESTGEFTQLLAHTGEYKQLLTDQQEFLQTHMLTWIKDFSEQIQKSKTNHLYPTMATLLYQFLLLDNNLLTELLEEAN